MDDDKLMDKILDAIIMWFTYIFGGAALMVCLVYVAVHWLL